MTNLSASQIISIAEHNLEHIAQCIDDQAGQYFDPQMQQQGVLNIETLATHDKRQFVLNINNTYMQIWLSSPISGGSHFAYNDQQWVSIRGEAINLMQQLSLDLKALCDIDVQF